MEEIKKLLIAEEPRLERIIQSTKKRLKSAPEGTLRLSNNKKGRMFYHYTGKKHIFQKMK